MKNLLLIIIVLISCLFSSAQTQSYRSDFWDSDNETSQKLLEALQENAPILHLLEWGWVKDNQLVDPHDWSNKNQLFHLQDNEAIHCGTDDGNYVYDVEISNGYLYLKNQRKLDDTLSTIKSSNPDYNGWWKIVGFNPDTFLIVDNIGVYRIFKLLK